MILRDASEVCGGQSQCSSAVLILSDYVGICDDSGKSSLTYRFIDSSKKSFGFLGHSYIWLTHSIIIL